MKHIGILIFDGVEELDAVGPWEVLAYWARNFPEDGYDVALLSADGGPVMAAKGMLLTPHVSRAAAPDFDVFLHPGGHGTRPLARDEEHLEWMRKLREDVPLMTSVCTGSLVYAAAGLLTGRPATSYWDALGDLAGLDPSIAVRPEARWVDDGDVVTSAGVSAGVDMALHLVRRLAGEQRAREVRRGIQYDPEPPV
ncbi:DJ-1/PfpI family protein [Arthrobacter sp. zg-Y820]|uniref:DJ-1/PfpI family protein n=1 Tax=unclassified Arthrobacter TaxID=235627 RepID=UPI001E2F76BB|nr:MULTISPECIES: DJ-1/PfpI family protein [unclassified Arthrobacter]MCC9196910.1 DJ-1/PfpI family protein [Arthrobacter sp. zg-Y820]MDK1279774.1 DJ-1/PfpI family protein [Arthrobacter sp. zg.Y820]WIB10973.1 DJ-1/PfpI family protein [Arthrobacter sp. zg-Y820]